MWRHVLRRVFETKIRYRMIDKRKSIRMILKQNVSESNAYFLKK